MEPRSWLVDALASMRPPNCFGGNGAQQDGRHLAHGGFNEAAELLRRKLVFETRWPTRRYGVLQ